MNIAAQISKSELTSILQRCSLNQFQGKRILITGANGMLGSYLTQAIVSGLEELGGPVPKIDLLVRQISNSNVAALVHDKKVNAIETWGKWKFPKSEYDYVIHAASPASPTKYNDKEQIRVSNLGFISSFFEEGLSESTFLFISSGEVYGPNPPVGFPENFRADFDPQSERSAYPLAKIQAEDELIRQCSDFRIARLFHTFGPGMKLDDGRSFADFLWASARGLPIQMRSEGQDVRTFLYLEDTVVALIMMLHEDLKNSVINVASDIPVTILDFAERISHLANTTPPKFHAKKQESYVHSPNHFVVPSNAKLRKIGWTQKVNLDESILRTLSWAQEELKIQDSR